MVKKMNASNRIANTQVITKSQTFSMLNDVKSPDNSIKVTGDATSGIDLSVTIKTDEKLGTLLKFELEKDTSGTVVPAPNIPGKHYLKVNSTKAGLIIVGGEVRVIEIPDYMAVLVIKNGGEVEWSQPPAENAAFGLKGGQPAWYEIDTCEGACNDESANNL